MDKVVHGHAAAKDALALGLYRAALSTAKGNAFGSSHLLMVGPTGCGKTALVRAAAELMQRSVFSVNCSQLVPAGIVGLSAQSLLTALIGFCGNSLPRAQKSILFLDEFDKLGDGTTLDRGLDVQASLLPLLDGSSLEVGFLSRSDESRVRFATKDLIIICAGAFTGLDAIVAKRAACGAAMGFATTPRRRSRKRPPVASIEPTDLIDLGFMPELLGRLRTIVTLDPLSESDLVAILAMDSPTAPLAQAKRWFAAHGTELLLDAGAKKAIAKRALQRGLGARALPSILTEVLTPAENIVCNSDRIVARVILSSANVMRGTPATLVYSDDPDRQYHHHSEAFALRAKAAVLPPTTVSESTNTADWTRNMLLEHLEKLRDKLELGKAPILVRHYWRDIEAASLHQAVSTAEELLERGLFVEHLYFAEKATGTYIPQVNIAYLDYMRAANQLPLVDHLRMDPQE